MSWKDCSIFSGIVVRALDVAMEQWPSGKGTGFLIQGSRVQNHWVAPRSNQPFILPRSIKWIPGISGNLVVKSKLPPRSGSSFEAVEPHPWKGAIKFFFKIPNSGVLGVHATGWLLRQSNEHQELLGLLKVNWLSVVALQPWTPFLKKEPQSFCLDLSWEGDANSIFVWLLKILQQQRFIRSFGKVLIKDFNST